MTSADSIRVGSVLLGDGRSRFCVWAPLAELVEVRILSEPERLIPLTYMGGGYHSRVVEGVHSGDRYLFRLDENLERPDPASRHQPDGVHGPSQVIDPGFGWTDERWRGIPLERYILYELHVGTFTPTGTFEAVIDRLDELVALGITALELMPVAQFPGNRNWGYDGVYPFAAQHSYGGPEGLKRLVDACHARGLAVVLDVVYNHVGPEGNYLPTFGPYFSQRYATPWGSPINFDGPHSDDVRRYFIENALYWIEDCHVDALRLDAVHAILDFSARPFLEELAQTVHRRAADLGRQVHLIAENALNDTRIIRAEEQGGFGLDAQWNDDLHHALHVLITGEREGYYGDFGDFDHLLKALREGFVYDGQYSPFRKRRHGNSSRDIPPQRLVVFSQNHDQIGNRLMGERLSALAPFEALKLAAGIILLSPNLPLLFMGEEYGETAPFPYFISHSDSGLIEAVRKGRREEFAAFNWQAEPPDPQVEATFLSAKLNPALYHRHGRHRTLRNFYRHLIELRTRISALAELNKAQMEVFGSSELRFGWLHRWSSTDEAVVMFHPANTAVSPRIGLPAGIWFKKLDSSSQDWGGPGTAAPDQIDANGDIELEFPPFTLQVWFRPRKG